MVLVYEQFPGEHSVTGMFAWEAKETGALPLEAWGMRHEA